jgi:sugar phosphate isomerase/epimerase
MLRNQIVLTALGAEISPSMDHQLEVLGAWDIRHLEVRCLKNKPLSSISTSHLKSTRAKLDKQGFAVSAIASSIGKLGLDDPFESHLKELERIQNAAEILGTRFIRVFSFYPDSWGNLLNRYEDVIDRMEAMTRKAEARNQVLLLENAPRVYGESPERCRQLLSEIDSPHLRASFDIGNFVKVNAPPFSRAFPLLEPWIDCVQVKDAQKDEQGQSRIVLAGQGDGQVEEIFSALVKRQKPVYLSIEPRGGQIAPSLPNSQQAMELCGQAVQAVRAILKRVAAKRVAVPQAIP